jgi:hypothetical protein
LFAEAVILVAKAAVPVVSWLSVPTVKSIVPSPSSYATVIPNSVFPETIAPTRSCISSVVFPPDPQVTSFPSEVNACPLVPNAKAVGLPEESP